MKREGRKKIWQEKLPPFQSSHRDLGKRGRHNNLAKLKRGEKEGEEKLNVFVRRTKFKFSRLYNSFIQHLPVLPRRGFP